MKKLILAALAGTLAVGSIAPAMAADTVFDHSSYYVLQKLNAEGYHAVDVAEWGTRIIATVVDANGHKSLVPFDPDTLTIAG